MNMWVVQEATLREIIGSFSESLLGAGRIFANIATRPRRDCGEGHDRTATEMLSFAAVEGGVWPQTAMTSKRRFRRTLN
jgi:hypothetical protein